MAQKAVKALTTHRRNFGCGTRMTIDGIVHVVLDETPAGIRTVVKNEDGKSDPNFHTHQKLADLFEAIPSRIEVHEGEPDEEIYVAAGIHGTEDLRPSQIRDINRRLFYIARVDDWLLENHLAPEGALPGEVDRYDKRFLPVTRAICEKVAPIIAPAVREFDEAVHLADNHAGISHTSRQGLYTGEVVASSQRSLTSKSPRSGTWIHRQWTKFKKHNNDIVALASRRSNAGRPVKTFAPLVLELMAAAIDRIARKECVKTKNGALAYAELVADIDAAKSAKKIARSVKVTRNDFEKALNLVWPCEIDAAKHGSRLAAYEYKQLGEGIRSATIGGRGEIDAQTADVMTFLEMAGLTNCIPAPLEALLRPIRVTVVMIVDTATGVILAMRMSPAEGQRVALATLSDVFIDKTPYGDTASCQMKWDHRCGLASIAHDNHAGYVGTEFASAVSRLGITNVATVQRNPQLRGLCERTFRTTGYWLSNRFGGATQSSVGLRGDYDAELHACLDVQQFLDFLIRIVVDVYHHTSGLLGGPVSPNRRWEELVDKACTPIPDMRKRTIAVGLTAERRLSNRGLRHFYLYYTSRELNSYLGRVPRDERNMKIHVSREDVSYAWTYFEGQWHLIRPLDYRLYEGITFTEFVRAMRVVQDNHEQMQCIDREVCLSIINGLREDTDRAREVNSLSSAMILDKEVADLERTMSIGDPFDMQEREGAPVGDIWSEELDTGCEIEISNRDIDQSLTFYSMDAAEMAKNDRASASRGQDRATAFGVDTSVAPPALREQAERAVVEESAEFALPHHDDSNPVEATGEADHAQTTEGEKSVEQLVREAAERLERN